MRPNALLFTAWLLVAVALAIVATLSLRHEIFTDEIEHVHAGWLVSSGERPFTDFFEHHHPLLWYLLAVVLPWTGQSASTLLLLRLLTLVAFVAIAVVTARIAAAGSSSRSAPWLAVALLLSMSEYVRVAYQIRPDVPETLCLVAALLVLLRAAASQRPSLALAAGLLAGLALLFSLKAALAIAPMLALFCWSCWRGRAPIALGAACLLGCAIPVLSYAAYLVATGAARDYYVANWALNAVVTAGRSRLRAPQAPIFINGGFWLAAAGGVLWAAAGRSVPRGVRWAAGVGGGTLGLLIATGHTESRSAVMAIPFLAVAAGAAVDHAHRKLRLSPISACALLIALCSAGLLEMGRSLEEGNRAQLELFDYVLQRTPPGEPVYDGSATFNLFRPDPHYFWFFNGPARHMRRDDTAGLAHRGYLISRLGPGSYDPCAITRFARPRIVSSRIGVEACGLAAAYRPSRYPGLLERRE